MEEILRAGINLDVHRRDRTLMREFKNESGGEINARSRLKWSPKKSQMREGSSIDFFQLIVLPRDCKSYGLLSMLETLFCGICPDNPGV